jgi:hypothetical protein
MAVKKRKGRRASPKGLSHDKTLAEMLRFFLSIKQGFLSVSQICDVADSVGDDEHLLTQVVVSVNIPNPKRGDGLRYLPVEKYREFFESWPVQKEFLLWVGKLLAESLPNSVEAATYKRKYAKLATGRPSKLPPNFYLRPQLEKVVAQLRAAQLFLTQRDNDHRTKIGRQKFLAFAKENRFDWSRLVENDQLDLAEIVTGNLRGKAYYVLSLLYDVSIEAVRSRLLRNV